MTYIIAELGINHDGDIKVVKKLIEEAAKIEVDAIKFQYRNISRAYKKDSRQIGDAMLKSEIEKNFLTIENIINLSKFAKNLGIDPGISFFTEKDYYDFDDHSVFEFYKVPSIEFSNTGLLKLLLNSGKQIYASIGCQNEDSVKKVLENFANYKNLNILYCVSNYPLAPHNCNLGYIKYFKETYKKEIGYSSHENDWKFTLFALAFGANVIERHITLGNRSGLDETSSSTVDQFSEMVKMVRAYSVAKKGYGPRKLNQGEKLNRQNLGRSFYFLSDYKSGEIINPDDLVYTSPAIGLNINKIDSYLQKTLIKNVKKGEVVTSSLFKRTKYIEDEQKEFCRKNKISLPVRVHDFESIRNDFFINNYEFHLSYTEVDEGLNNIKVYKDDRYSIHLPDYIGPLNIINPFGNDEIKSRSSKIINSTINFGKKIQDITGSHCPIVGSFSIVSDTDDNFYSNIAELCLNVKKKGISLFPQWLPPIAWYFGGSAPLTVFNSSKDVFFLEKYKIPICFDSAHFLMCSNSDTVNLNNDFNRLMSLTSHIHISGADGLDGEGTSFSSMDPNSLKILRNCLNKNTTKVIETWQGHLDNFSGFHKSIYDLINIKD
jgi:sialic acid synthase SpsE